MRKQYFQYIILVHPTKDELEKGKSTELIKDEKLLASSSRQAELQIIKGLTDEQFDKMERNELEIIVRPF